MADIENPAIFLDRDGTIIEDTHYPRDPKKVILIPNAIEGLREMQRKGYLLFVISNQSGVGRGFITDDEFRLVHEKVSEMLKQNSVDIKEFAYCFHKPEDQCPCRKPGTLFINQFKETHQLSLTQSFSVGDKWCDVEMGLRAGAQGTLVLTGKGKSSLSENKEWKRNGLVFEDLLGFAQFLPTNI